MCQLSHLTVRWCIFRWASNKTSKFAGTIQHILESPSTSVFAPLQIIMIHTTNWAISHDSIIWLQAHALIKQSVLPHADLRPCDGMSSSRIHDMPSPMVPDLDRGATLRRGIGLHRSTEIPLPPFLTWMCVSILGA